MLVVKHHNSVFSKNQKFTQQQRSIKGIFDKIVDFIAGKKHEKSEGPSTASPKSSSTAPPKSTHCGKTYALVIGISEYITRGMNPLDNATNDSRLVINMHWNLAVTLILTLTLTLTLTG